MPEALDLPTCSPLSRPQLSEEDAAALERLFLAFADRHRVKVLNILAQAGGDAVCVCDFQEALGLKQPTVSYHLRQLVDSGMLARERRGRYAFYSLRPGVLDRIAALFGPERAAASERVAG